LTEVIEKGREGDQQILMSLSREELHKLLFTHLRNMWAVDGLYFLGIEERWGTNAATDIDKNVWAVMGKLEARYLKRFLGREDDIPSMMKALSLSGWELVIEEKEYEVGQNEAIVRNTNCRVQNTRLKKELGEFSCKQVRWEFLKAFAKEFNPDIEVKCMVCPPDDHPTNLWCEWKFVNK